MTPPPCTNRVKTNKHNGTLITQTQFQFFKSTLKLRFCIKPRFRFFVITANGFYYLFFRFYIVFPKENEWIPNNRTYFDYEV